jgi:hypothetical protein
LSHGLYFLGGWVSIMSLWQFPDVRAALAVSLYAQGLTAEAETNWLRMEDGRYRDRNWVRQTRRWPPRLVSELEAFLDLKSVVSS